MKEYNKLPKKYTILLISITIFLCLTLIGMTYSWFDALVKGNDNATENVVETGALSINYTNSYNLEGNNILPGWSETKTFTVENTGTVAASYSITWANLLNEFVNKEDLVYSLISNNNGGTLEETQLPETGYNINILTDITIDPGTTQTYILTVLYKNKDKDQTSDSGKRLLGKIEIEDRSEETTTKYMVQLKVENGKSNQNVIRVANNDNAEFNIMPNIGYTNPSVNCANEVETNLTNNILTINEVTENTNCTLTYEPDEFEINYELNGGSLENFVTSYTIESENIKIDTPIKEGYIFNGWKEENNEPNKNYVISKGTYGNKTLIADYTPITYGITYDSNTGSQEVSSVRYNYDSTVTLKTSPFGQTKEGYDFIGWSTNKDAITPLYAGGEEVKNLTNVNNKIVTLYAVWKIKSYEVNVTVLNGKLTGETNKLAQYQSSTTFVTEPAEGYENPTVDCTNNQTGNITDYNLSVNNLTNDTTCTITYEDVALLATDLLVSKYNASNTEGLIKINQPQTTQMKSNIEYRYSGSNVKNYVNFNNELWRIIGVFEVDNGSGVYEQRVKLMKDSSIGLFSWRSSGVTNSGRGTNYWGSSETYKGGDLMRLFNPGYTGTNGSFYYNSESGICTNWDSQVYATCDFTSTGLKEEAKTMISDAKWYIGAITNNDALTMYKQERSTIVGLADVGGITITKSPSWVGKVGLIYASDYAYASKNCTNLSTAEYSQDSCKNSNWLYSYRDGFYFLTISPSRTGEPYYIYAVSSDGHAETAFWASRTGYTAPTLYLKPNVKITGGKGTSGEPYNLRV